MLLLQQEQRLRQQERPVEAWRMRPLEVREQQRKELEKAASLSCFADVSCMVAAAAEQLLAPWVASSAGSVGAGEFREASPPMPSAFSFLA